MTPYALEVRCRVVGQSRTDRPLDRVILQLLEERLTVAELIRRTVEEQVRELLVRRRVDAEAAREAFDRQYLTAEEIAAQAKRGAVRLPSPRPRGGREIDPASEVQKALRGFEAGAYLVFVDGRQVERLDEEFIFSPGAKVTFLRLTPLVGG